MSKTRKIRCLKRQLGRMNEENKLLFQQFIATKTPKFNPVERPVFRSSDWEEERVINLITNHIYDTLDDTLRFHNKCSDECNFVVYMSRDVLYRINRISGYPHITADHDRFYFMGWEVVEVVGKENYVHFSLLNFKG